MLVLVLVVLYYALPLKIRWCVLLIGSIFFYYAICKTGWQVTFGIILVTYAASLLLHNERIKRNAVIRKACFITAVVMTVIPWFITKNGVYLFSVLLHRDSYAWIMPVGISFYTLQIISYLTDIYKNEIVPQKNIAKYALFVMFFPQIVQGPIPKYKRLSIQLYEGHTFREQNLLMGFYRIIWGFFLKYMIADKAAVVVNEVFDKPGKYTGFFVVAAAVLYSAELYADFMACVSISKGVSRLFGIELDDNFRHPYFATSVQDFWRRWHISLSVWLKDYIYIPLGGSKKGKLRKYANLCITFIISGIWHGTGAKYLLWGLLHAFYQIAASLTEKAKGKFFGEINWQPDSKSFILLQRIITFLLVTIAWIIFRANNLKQGLVLIRDIFVFNPWLIFNDAVFQLGLSWRDWGLLIFSVVLLIYVSKKQEEGISVSEWIIGKPLIFRYFISIAAILAIMVFGTYGFGYNMQDFIYGGF